MPIRGMYRKVFDLAVNLVQPTEKFTLYYIGAKTKSWNAPGRTLM